MNSAVHHCAIVCAILASLELKAQDPTPPKSDTGQKSPIDSLKLPPGTVIFVTPNPRDANPNVHAVILTPEEYRKLLDSAAQLQKLSTPDRPDVPSVCRLELRREPETENMMIRAHFQFRTERPQSVIALGLQQARPVKAQLDSGKLPALVTAPDGGFQLTVDSPGEHRLSVEAIVPLTNRNGNVDRGIALGLPGSAITILETLELQTDARRVRINGKPTTAPISASSTLVLGPARVLEAVWELGPSIKPGDSMFIVESRVEARMEDRILTTLARHNIKVLRGTVAEFQLTAPATAKVNVLGSKTVVIDSPNEMRRNQWTLRRAASADDLTIEVQIQQPITRRPLSIQSFPIARAAQIRGTLTLTAPDTHRMVMTPRVELSRQDEELPAAVQRREVYDFASVPANGVLADVDPQPVKGEVETTIHHSLRLITTSWRLTTRLELRPIGREIDRLEFEIPSELRDFRIVPSDAAEVVGASKDSSPGFRIVPLRLNEVARKPISLTLEGYFETATGATATGLLLPRIMGTLDRGGTVQLAVPPGTEVRGEVREWYRDRVADWEYQLKTDSNGAITATTDRAPARVEVNWRATASTHPIRATINVEFDDTQARMRQIFRIPSAPRQLSWFGPTALLGRINLIDGGTLAQAQPGEWVVRPIAATGKEAVLTFETAVPFDHGSTFMVPLLWPERSHRCEIEVRVWAAPGTVGPRLPSIDGGNWTQIPLPVVADHPRLPALALRGSGTELPLNIRFAEIGNDQPSAIIDRTWVRAAVDDVGAVAMRTRFLVRPLRGESLAIRLPGPPILLRPTVRVDGRAVDVELQNQQLLVPLTLSANATHVVDISCTLPARSGWNVKLDSPRPVGPVIFGSIRWQIHGPEGDVGFETSNVLTPIVRWGWERGLLSPMPGVGDAAMVRWFAGDLTNVTAEPFEAQLMATSSLIHPVWMLYLPRPIVSLVASLTLLAVGGLLLMMRWTPIRLAVLVLAIAALFVAGWLWPQAAGVVLAMAQPGILVLIPSAMIATWIKRRAERRAVFASLRIAPTLDSSPKSATIGRAAV